MVVYNGFKVTLYDPDSGSPYKEFNKDGIVYIEAYQDGQYYIQVEMVDEADCHNGVRKDKALACFSVDKKLLECTKRVVLNGGAKRAGIATKEGARAFKFVLPKQNVDTEKAGANPMAPLYGEIVVEIHEALLTTYMAPVVSPFSSASSAGSTSGNAFSSEARMKVDIPAELEKVKVFRSTAGTTMIPAPAAVSPLCGKKLKPSFRLKRKYEWGPLITSIRLRYCGTVGLIVAGLLPKPRPDWKPQDAVPARAPKATLPSFDHSKVVSQKIHYQDDNGMAHEAMQYDLTGLPDDEDKTK